MDRYQRVEKPRNDTPISQNEIRITTQGRMRNYISYGMSLLEENGHDEISIKAMGRAINKTVMVVELIKRRVGGLHQNTATESVDITDTWEPLEEGLLPLETTRHVSMITVTLSKNPLDTSSPGYQPPIPAEEVKPAFDYDHEESYPTGRGRGRGGGRRGRGRGMSNGPPPPAYGYNEEWEEEGDYYNRGRGRGRLRGRGGRRGGYGYDYGYAPRGGYYEEQDEYYDEPEEYAPPPGRGRGRGRRGGMPWRGRGGRGPPRGGRGSYY
uniref:DNA/RNA-binding protein Alba-like domain-containing protein n=1 Tax=Zea mays TaxID=4577 RepID=A0A804MJX3_MAIZE